MWDDKQVELMSVAARHGQQASRQHPKRTTPVCRVSGTGSMSGSQQDGRRSAASGNAGDPHRTVASQHALPPEGSQEHPRQIGRYRIDRLLGTGGFGRVFLAYDTQLKRTVAIKTPHAHLLSHPEDARAYLIEAQTLASLDHPNIVPVYDVGSGEGLPYYVVSKYIEGTDLGHRTGERQMSHPEAARLVAAVAEALHYAHTRGLVHRDIKPGNILLDTEGTPYLVDFGLALREAEVGTGPRYAGTPVYMSPEQARGEGHRVDGRSDIYSLGCVFYELLAGRRPFSSESQTELFQLIVHHDPKPPRQIDDTVPRELERICLKALAKRATDRYTTARDLADDLAHYLAAHPPELAAAQGNIAEPERQRVASTQVSRDSHTIDTASSRLRVVPKGLRSFDEHDADFFLELLPGPRDRHGLPDSIRFWKTRIEERDPDKTFSVGLIYGPSGCGKSSLIKAGLLPHLSDEIAITYVEAAGRGTETRLLHALRKRCPGLSSELDLPGLIAALRRQPQEDDGAKILIVLDQFEQWLHGHTETEQATLVQALRQCDGGRVQCVIMVRDDFWMAATRFMRELEVRIVEGSNSAAVDLFPPRHARRVLAAFGRAFGELPEHGPGPPKAERAFLDQAIDQLAEDGKVICVRLALFAEMMKGRPWTPATLRDVGGAEGIGVAFLEETFCGGTAPPEHRYHERAARAVLKLLLPHDSAGIKGRMRAYTDLLAASGYRDRPKDFADLLELLDNQLRLITPVDPTGLADDAEKAPAAAPADAQEHYQLTHDYLVPSLYDWLSKKQKETRRGRAELRLAERSAHWSARQEKRNLPQWWEDVDIRLFTRRREWNETERRMMRQSGRHYGLRAAIAAVLVLFLVFIGFRIRGQIVDTRQATYAASLVSSLLRAETQNVPGILAEMEQYGTWIDVPLRKAHEAALDDSTDKLRTSLALLEGDTSQRDYLFQRLLRAEPDEVPMIVGALSTERDGLASQLWKVADDSTGDGQQRLRCACALAAFDPTSPRWSAIRDDVARQLVAADPLAVSQWQEALRPVSETLIKPLSRFFADSQVGELERSLATSLLADYAANDLERLTQFICQAEPKQFSILYPVLERHGDEAARQLSDVLHLQPTPTWNDPVIPADWAAVESELQRRIIAADGIIHPCFAFCQTLPIRQWEAVADGLSRSGYGPIHVRPYWNGTSVQLAVIWTRDGGEWEVTLQATPDVLAERDTQLRQQGFLPQDVCGYFADQAGREGIAVFAAAWQRDAGSETEVRMVAGATPEQMDSASAELLQAGFNQWTCSVVSQGAGREYHSAVFRRPAGQKESSSKQIAGNERQFRGDVYPGLLLSDAVALQLADPATEQGQSPDERQRHGVWNASTEYTSLLVFGHSPQSHLERSRELIAKGYRPAALSVTTSADATLTVAAVWHQPRIPESDKETLARRQANAALALFRLQQYADVWPLLHRHPDPRLRSYLIDLPGRLGANAETIFERLSTERNVSSRQALILALGGFAEVQIPDALRRAMTTTLLQLYETDPDAGIHAAAEWGLRRWGQQREMRRIADRLATAKIAGEQLRRVNLQNWHINGQGQTFVALGPVAAFVMGSPVTEEDRVGGPTGETEQQHWMQIDRRFLIMMHEVTVEQFQRFRADFLYGTAFSPTPDCPINQVTWYDAAAYCNWLSAAEGIAQGQWCYLPNSDGEYAAGMTPAPDFLTRTGYRLPTETEWEYACRGMSETSRCYGETKALLARYARYSEESSDRRALPVGSLKPNDFGLFDMHGNALEWCQDAIDYYVISKDSLPMPDRVDTSPVTDAAFRVLRGADFYAPAEHVRSARRHRYAPQNRVSTIGLRLARTLPPADDSDPVGGTQ